MTASTWDQRYRDGNDRWELGKPAPPLDTFLRTDSRTPHPPARVLVPGCGRGHEVALLADLGYEVIGLDFSGEAIERAQAVHGSDSTQLRWLQADLFDGSALAAAGITTGSLQGVLEHTCFCAIDPTQRGAYVDTAARLLAPGGWLLGLFWCHPRRDGPPWGSDPALLAQQLAEAGFHKQLWERAQGSEQGSALERDNEWLGLWRR
ncbi:methyltransferase domain-containing protein [Cyanobium sp. T1G-Tous]|uniref:methyltransferase domain-containing protein n=1 Tax=unclassified Cyanobium TaxID=2627006 RepID=UPI0020CE6574|nr:MULTISPECIES: methyltransferase domain-containing protein [unclassified Cyanobium]MCP9803524.1 methyltransferase domain-containing protein [Cyanobium sp. T1G-Tous]MCP9807524.1 methyltransferase domain-containing protein [Cyanobium sp. T1B-Tous]MCP9875754.1 methyltransferase domain-containing protein [Cyanobium sp. A2C-AMD]